ncbi:MAG: deoxyribose-phosphate aldolase [Candidatus Delongbacteria bacterium]|nr:deoxyribose-phosphate aldolase [Candidatus Delongbacteria bacterium]MBN2834530.1 deoxyribose-phosphate aldolase [Candidatus Delongbacteria bacterium]
MSIYKKIEHTLLRLDTTLEQIEKDLKLCIDLGVRTIVVPPSMVQSVSKMLKGNILLCSVAGFPNGYTDLSIKKNEILNLFDRGCVEVDIVPDHTLFFSGKLDLYKEHLDQFRKLTDKPLKIIVETSLYNPKQILEIAEMIYQSGIDYFKTSTGFNGDGARLSDVVMVKNKFNDKLKIKASGGIRTLGDAEKFINAGVDLIGTSSTFKF